VHASDSAMARAMQLKLIFSHYSMRKNEQKYIQLLSTRTVTRVAFGMKALTECKLTPSHGGLLVA
jgi:hypothetical protein